MANDRRLHLVGGTTVNSGSNLSSSGSGGGEGGGMSDDLEKRFAAIEVKMEKVDGKLDAIKEMNAKLDGLVKDTSYLRGKVDAMPTTLQLLGFIIAVLAIAGLAKYLTP